MRQHMDRNGTDDSRTNAVFSWAAFVGSLDAMLLVEVVAEHSAGPVVNGGHGCSARIIDANLAAQELLGRGRLDLLGTPFADLARQTNGVTATTRAVPASNTVHVITLRAGDESPRPPTPLRAHRPELTDMPKRDALVPVLLRAFDRAQTAAVAIVDLDNFRAFNETSGTRAGDAALCAAAEAIQSVIRSVDTAIRYGGDEFVIVFPGFANEPDAYRVGARINRAVERTVDKKGRSLTASIGAALIDAQSDGSFAAMQTADAALYDAKRAGGNRVMVRSLTTTPRSPHPLPR